MPVKLLVVQERKDNEEEIIRIYSDNNRKGAEAWAMLITHESFPETKGLEGWREVSKFIESLEGNGVFVSETPVESGTKRGIENMDDIDGVFGTVCNFSDGKHETKLFIYSEDCSNELEKIKEEYKSGADKLINNFRMYYLPIIKENMHPAPKIGLFSPKVIESTVLYCSSKDIDAQER